MDYFKHVNNFEKYKEVSSNLIKGSHCGESPSLSIVIPTFNRAGLLKEAVDSALSQETGLKYEVVVVDNNPQRDDDTEIMLSQYGAKNLYYYKNDENIGMAGNINRAIELASSNWVILLHDDDVMGLNYVAVIQKYLVESNTAIIKPYLMKFDEVRTPLPVLNKNISLKKLHLADFMFNCAIGAPTNILINKQIFIKCGGFNENVYPSFDYLFAAKCVLEHDVYILPQKIGYYRVSQNASISEKTMNMYHIKRYEISRHVMLLLGINNCIGDFLQSLYFPISLENTNLYYNVNYQFSFKEIGLKKYPNLINRLFKIVHSRLISVIKQTTILLNNLKK